MDMALAAAATEERETVRPVWLEELLAQRPLYKNEHDCCSVAAGSFRNVSIMQRLSPKRQFVEWHRVYVELDRIFEECGVFKLCGGPSGFIIAANVSEQDEQHAKTVHTAALRLQEAASQIQLPGPDGTSAPLELVMALASGPAVSGLMGDRSRAYQGLIGEDVAVAYELSRYQRVPLMVTRSTYDLLPAHVQDSLHRAGDVQLRCLSGSSVTVFTAAQHEHNPLLQPHEQPVPRMLWEPVAGSEPGHARQVGQPGGEEEGEEQPEQENGVPPFCMETHDNCSVLLGSIANSRLLHSMPLRRQFIWWHRFYLLLDSTIKLRNQDNGDAVYKLFGGPAGFMICTNVAEPDPQHAATLFQLGKDLRTIMQQLVKLPGAGGRSVPVELVMTLSSGPAASGLLGTTCSTYQIVGRAAALACELNPHQHVPLLVTESAYHELPDEMQQLCGPRCIAECPDGRHAAVYSLLDAAGLQVHDPLAAEDAAADRLQPENRAPASPQVSGTTCAALAAQQRLEEGAPSATAAAQLAAKWSTAGEGPSTPTGSQSPAAVASLAPTAGQAAAEERSAAAQPAVQPGGEASKQADCEAAAPYRVADRYAMDAVLRFENPAAEAAFARFATGRPVEPGTSFVLAALGLLCLLALPSTWQDPALPLLLAAHCLPLLAAALCCWMEVSDAWRWFEGLWFVQRALAVEALRQGAWLGGHGAFPLPAWAASLAALSVQASLVLPVRFHQHLLASLLTCAMVLTCGISLRPGAWALLMSGEAVVALVAWWRERRARRRFVQAQPSRQSTARFAITARAG